MGVKLSAVVNVTMTDDYWSAGLDPYEFDTDKMGNPYSEHNPNDPNGASRASGVVHPSMIVLIVVGLVLVVGGCGVFFLKWQRRRFRDCPWNSGNLLDPLSFAWESNDDERSIGRQAQDVSVLTFTNPNYSPSAPDVVVEKKTFSWQRWKYDRHQERVYDMQVVLALI